MGKLCGAKQPGADRLSYPFIELRPGTKPGDPAVVVDFQGNYEDFLESAGAALAAV